VSKWGTQYIIKYIQPENEHLWFGILLALWNQAVVPEPEKLKYRLCEKAKEILDVYQ
jgi:hypothetical protein